MNRTPGDMDDAMAIRLKEPDLGVRGISAHGQARAMAMALTLCLVDAGIRETGGVRDLEKARPCVFG
jgi:hypothetical protein